MKTAKQKVLCGADVVARDGLDFHGRCGLITNHTGVKKIRDLSGYYLFIKNNPNRHTAIPAAFVKENDSLYKK